jgi:hypothetical protein
MINTLSLRQFAIHTCWVCSLIFLTIVAVVWSEAASAQTILLDADTPATGSDLDVQSLVTPYGNITFSGEIRDKDSDLDFDAAGALGDVFDIDESEQALLTFAFDVQSISFIYGGNIGVFDVEARDINGVALDSFFQASTDFAQPAGPITLSGDGIRSLFWRDPGNAFAAIDNVTIEVIPEPGTCALLSAAIAGSLIPPGRRARIHPRNGHRRI